MITGTDSYKMREISFNQTDLTCLPNSCTVQSKGFIKYHALITHYLYSAILHSKILRQKHVLM